VRTKFLVDEKTETKDGFKIILRAVSCVNKENQQFFNWTPNAKLEMSMLNKDTSAQLEVGKEYYLELTVSDKEIEVKEKQNDLENGK
jgi:hypothetical protein